MAALDKAVQDKVELYVAYNYPYKQQPFRNGRTWYYPVYTGNIICERIKRRFFLRKRKNLTEEYLKLVRLIHPDVIHIHGSENSFHCIVGKTDVPIAVSIQGNPTVYAYKYKDGFHGKYIHLKERFSLKSFLLGRTSYMDSLKDLLWLSKIEQQNLPHIKYIIGRTDWDRRITRVLSPRSRYFVVNEALRDSFYNHKWGMDAPINKLIIHTTNGNNYYKGFETICQTLELLNNLGVNVEWRVAGVSDNSAINLLTKKYLGALYPQKGLVLMGALDEKNLVD